jgi:hypothetical protein
VIKCPLKLGDVWTCHPRIAILCSVWHPHVRAPVVDGAFLPRVPEELLREGFADASVRL